MTEKSDWAIPPMEAVVAAAIVDNETPERMKMRHAQEAHVKICENADREQNRQDATCHAEAFTENARALFLMAFAIVSIVIGGAIAYRLIVKL